MTLQSWQKFSIELLSVAMLQKMFEFPELKFMRKRECFRIKCKVLSKGNYLNYFFFKYTNIHVFYNVFCLLFLHPRSNYLPIQVISMNVFPIKLSNPLLIIEKYCCVFLLRHFLRLEASKYTKYFLKALYVARGER